MPYYCTVPRCTSMAGKAKNVSFHQFPRDEELGKLWNEILKRGKPYTKYSKVCSLHFKPEDYTITGLGRNKGQWRTLRKDAVPSQNLPSDSPIQCHKTKNKVSRIIDLPTGIMDAQLQHVAQAFYTQTMLAIHASGVGDLNINNIYNDQTISANGDDSTSGSSNSSGHFNETMSQIEHLLHKNNINTDLNDDSTNKFSSAQSVNSYDSIHDFGLKHTYKCKECSKCFKDPDVFFLHKRAHMPKNTDSDIEALRKTLSESACSEKENFDNSSSQNCNENSTEETLRANPILANLLKSSIPHSLHKSEMQQKNDFKNIASIENQIMAAMATNMKNYFKNLSSIMTPSLLSKNYFLNDKLAIRAGSNYSEESNNADEFNDITSEDIDGIQEEM